MISSAVAATLLLPSSSFATYRVERIASGLNQPTYVTQAPGDPANILYFTERAAHDGAGTFGGFGAINNMGKVWRYDVNTRTKTLVLDLAVAFPSRTVTNDTGVQGVAFSPDFNTPGTPTYQKMYVSYSARSTVAQNYVEEFNIGAGGTATLSTRGTILQYPNSSQNNHTVDWIGFDPNAVGAARSHLYISTGDGAFGNNYNSGLGTNGRPSQNPSDVKGKILRVDVNPSLADAYGGDALKNFAIPSSNPIPTWNAANPGSPIMGVVSVGGVPTPAPGLGEVWVTGMRNGYRMSFDRANSDLYWGDVGEVAIEEVGFLKAGTNTSGPPVDFGWPQLESTANSNVSGAPHTNVNPFTGVTSTLPIQQFNHSVGLAVIGGYVHRGDIPELQGKYFFGDFAGVSAGGGQNGKLWMLDFDRNTPTGSFNANNGTLTDVTALLNSLVVDTNDPSYLPSNSATDLAGLDHIVSFGEDNAGNIYLVDFGNRTLGTGTQSFFDGQYPHLGLGEIFRLTLVTSVTNATWNIDASSIWSLAGNWTGGVPNGVGAQANFGPAITLPRTVSVNSPHTVSTITFNSSTSYTIAGPSTLTLQGTSPAAITVNSGTHTISASIVLNSDLTLNTTSAGAAVFLDSPINASGRTINKLGPGTAQFVNIRAATVLATEGTLRVSAKAQPNSTAGTSVVTSLVIGGSGELDLTNNSMVIDYTGPVGTLVDDTRANMLNARLISSSAGAATTLGYGDNALLGFGSFGGQTVDASSVLVKFTYGGDTDLDGDVDVADLGTLASSWQTSGVWTDGDFDYNGSIEVGDLGLLATNWQAGVGDPLAPSLAEALAAFGLPQVTVPEPTSLLLLACAGLVGRARRR